MPAKFYKTVLIPISVPVGDYCWGPHPEDSKLTVICEHFDNEGGHPHCNQGYDMPTYSKYPTMKPKNCKGAIDV